MAVTPARLLDRPNPRRRIETMGPGLLGFTQRQEGATTVPATIPRGPQRRLGPSYRISYLTANWSTHPPEDVKTDSTRAITDLDRHVVTGDRKIIKRMMVLAHESRCSIIRAGIKINSTLDTRTHARSVSDLIGDLEKPVMGKLILFY